MSQWYYNRQGQTVGPFSPPEFQRLAAEGRLLPDDLVSRGGDVRWVPARSVRGLFPAVPAAGQIQSPAPDRPRPATEAAAPDARPHVTRPRVTRPLAGVVGVLLGLPKPILFGLFGGAGGLLGAILLGELLWQLLSPPGLPPRVQVGVPESVRVYAGGKNTFLVKIARQGFRGPVRVAAVTDPGISTTAVEIDPGQDQAEIEVNLAGSLPVGSHAPVLHASGPEGSGVEPASIPLSLSVEVPPPALAVSASPEVPVEQGGRARFAVRVARARFDEPVTLRFPDLPSGVTLAERTVPAGQKDVLVELRAAAGVPLGGVPVTVQANARVGGTTLTADARFDLTVKPPSPPAVDVVFVLDLTGSMGFAIEGIKRGIRKFAEQLGEKHFDARMGLVGFRDVDDDRERPFLLAFDGKPFTKDYKAFREQVEALRASGGGDEPESSLQALALAAGQTFRPNASRVLVLITDAPPKHHPDEKPSTVNETVEELKKSEIDQVHLVGRPIDRDDHYLPFTKEFAGSFFDLTAAANGDAFAELLPALSRDISRLTIAAGPRGIDRSPEPPPLPPERTPSQPPAAEPVLKAVQSTQAFAARDRFRILAALTAWTMVVAGGISLFLLAGQQFHARKGRLTGREAGGVAAGGLLAGLVGGAVGQLVFQATSGEQVWDTLSRLLGWGVLGALVGAAMALFVPNLKWHRGALGGLVGGVAGALAFLLVSLLLGSLLARWLGAAILGFCIGLMVALAELAFRRFWLEVAVSPREVRTVTLGPTAVVLGGDERQASFFVRGAAPVALRFWVEGDEVLCEDLTACTTTPVAPGDARGVGGVTVTVRSHAGARPSGYELEFAGGKSLPLQEGMPLTADDLPGLEPKGPDGMVALVGRQPNRPGEVVLRNRSNQSWTARKAGGEVEVIAPGRGLELGEGVAVNFGQVTGVVRREGGRP